MDEEKPAEKKYILTIGILTYYKEHHLERVLDSIVGQFSDPEVLNSVEVVVSDDAGLGNARTPVEKYSAKYPNIRFNRNQTNLRFDRNVDKVFSMARGRYAWVMSDDDTLQPGSIKFLLDEIHKYPEVEYICSVGPEIKITEPLIDGQVLIRDYPLIGGLVSQNIFKLEKLPKDREKYYGNFWMHFSIAYEMAGRGKVLLIKNLLKEGQEQQVSRWAQGGMAFKTFISLKRIIANLVLYGYDPKIIGDVLKKFSKNLPRNVASARLHGLPFSLSNIKILISEFGSYPVMLLASLLILVVPVSVLRQAAKALK